MVGCQLVVDKLVGDHLNYLVSHQLLGCKLVCSHLVDSELIAHNLAGCQLTGSQLALSILSVVQLV